MDPRDALQPHHLFGLDYGPLRPAEPSQAEPHWSRKWLFRVMLFVGWISAFYLIALLKIIVPALAVRLWH